MTIYNFFAIFVPILSACVAIIVIFIRVQSIYTLIYALQNETKNLTRDISELSIKVVDIPLPNFEEISRNLITLKNALEEVKGSHENLQESFLTYQNKMASRFNQEKREKKRKEEPECEEPLYSDISTVTDTGDVVDRRDISPKQSRLINKVKYLTQAQGR
jgi:hypothetical protein